MADKQNKWIITVFFCFARSLAEIFVHMCYYYWMSTCIIKIMHIALWFHSIFFFMWSFFFLLLLLCFCFCTSILFPLFAVLRFVLVPLLWCDPDPKITTAQGLHRTYIIIMLHIPKKKILFDHHQRRTSIIVKQINVVITFYFTSFRLYTMPARYTHPSQSIMLIVAQLVDCHVLSFFFILPHFRWIILFLCHN